MRLVRLPLVPLLFLSPVAAPGGPASALHREPRPAMAQSMVRLSVSMTADSAGAVGTLTLKIRSGTHTRKRIVRAAQKEMFLPFRARVRLNAQPTVPGTWTFREWRVSPRGGSAFVTAREQFALTLKGDTAVRAEFALGVTPTPPPTPAGATQTATPSATEMAVSTAGPSPSATTEPICRSWHPRPHCRFPTPTPAA